MSKDNIYNSPTFRLIRNKPSFLEGFFGLINFKDVIEHYNASDTEQEADIKAITSDWDAIGIDMRNITNTNTHLQLKHGR